MPDSSQITTVDAAISISESRPNPASATDRAETAAMARTTIPAMFQASVKPGTVTQLPGPRGHRALPREELP